MLPAADGLPVRPKPVLYGELFSKGQYDPTALVERPYPVKDLDFTSGGAYSVYNWELFFHVPFTIAIHLSKNQRFEDAQRWFHYLFDPTDDSDGPTPERFWKVRPFQYTDVKKIEEILVNLASGDDPALKRETIAESAWKDAPFRPHVIALPAAGVHVQDGDGLPGQPDRLGRLAVPAGHRRGDRRGDAALRARGQHPRPAAAAGAEEGVRVRPQTYANLRQDLDAFGNALREVEADMPFDLAPPPPPPSGTGQTSALSSLGKALYFCVPRNDKLLGYWDTVADRLFKIRNSLNIQGVFRQLPLFEPPIDPAMLARAAAGGLDVGAIVSGPTSRCRWCASSSWCRRPPRSARR